MKALDHLSCTDAVRPVKNLSALPRGKLRALSSTVDGEHSPSIHPGQIPPELSRQGHLEHLRAAALDQEPTAFGQISPVERREAGAEDRLSFDAFGLQRQAGP